MKNTRNISPVGAEPKPRNIRPRAAGSLVSDRLGAQGFTEPDAERSTEITLGAKRIEPRAEQELGAPPRTANQGEGSPQRN